MTTFNSINRLDHQIEISNDGGCRGIFVRRMVDGDSVSLVTLAPADDAAIALAVMEAAQHETQNGDPGSADYARNEAINWLMTARDRTAKEAAQAVKDATLNRRRDELARALNENCHNFLHATASLQDAIDMILERDDRITNLENQE